MNQKKMIDDKEKLEAYYKNLSEQMVSYKDLLPGQMVNGLTNLSTFLVECSPKYNKMPGFTAVTNRLPKESLLKKQLVSIKYKNKTPFLYKYIRKEYASDLLIHGLLYCDTISNFRKGEMGDPEETVFFDMKQIIFGNTTEEYEFINDILVKNGLPEYNHEAMFNAILGAIGSKRICCVSKSPYIKEMWEWKGNEEAICVPIDISGKNFYEIQYTDETIDPTPYCEYMMNLIGDATVGKISRKKVQRMYDDFTALTYLSICKKKTKRKDGTRWDVQQECRMFPERFESLGDKKNCYVSFKGNIGKPITYEDYLHAVNKDG